MLSHETSERKEREKFTVERVPDQKPHSDDDFFGPVLPLHLLRKNADIIEDKGGIYGPLLPDHLSKKENPLEGNLTESDEIFIGPSIPEQLRCDSSTSASEDAKTLPSGNIFGPSVDLMASGDIKNFYTFKNVESSEKILQDSTAKRETWMTELPEKMKANFGLFPRRFRSHILTDKESDGSSWTETPSEKLRNQGSQKNHVEILQIKRLQERDQQMEKLAKKAAKKLRKKESLLELHLKSKKAAKEKAKKKEKKGNSAPERRPFDRNIDLQVRRFDESQTRAIINKSRFLNDRFAPGQSKFL